MYSITTVVYPLPVVDIPRSIRLLSLYIPWSVGMYCSIVHTFLHYIIWCQYNSN